MQCAYLLPNHEIGKEILNSLTWPCDYEDNNDDKKSEIEDIKKYQKICAIYFLFQNKILNLIFLALDSKPRLRDRI